MPTDKTPAPAEPAARSRSLQRAEKLVNRAGWFALRASTRSPQITELHRRLVPAPAGDIVEFVRSVDEPAVIEPLYGYVVTRRGVLLEDSLHSNFRYKAPWRNGLPSANVGWRLRRGALPEALRFKRVISLRHWWEWNYYHFFLDVLGKLNLFDQLHLDPDIPLILGPYAGQLPWVREILDSPGFHGRKWIVPDKVSVMADQVIYCRTQQNYKERMDPVLDALETPRDMAAYNDRIFLNRGATTPRRLANQDEVWAVLDRLGFRMIDTAPMSIREKIEIFSKTRYLVALHGAGSTNILFRRGSPLKLLELQSRAYPPPEKMTDFGKICRAYGHDWDRLLGEPANPNESAVHGNFTILPADLESKLRTWLNEPALA